MCVKMMMTFFLGIFCNISAMMLRYCMQVLSHQIACLFILVCV